MDDGKKGTKQLIDKILKDIKASTSKQLIISTSSGWLTGYLAIKMGKAVAFVVGAGIILLEMANQKDYIKVNWDKINNKQLNKVSDRIEEETTGQDSYWMDMVNAFARFNDSFTAGFIGGFLVSLAFH